jgi:hypothetical protein
VGFSTADSAENYTTSGDATSEKPSSLDELSGLTDVSRREHVSKSMYPVGAPAVVIRTDQGVYKGQCRAQLKIGRASVDWVLEGVGDAR